jgi:hypothetical protein
VSTSSTTRAEVVERMSLSTEPLGERPLMGLIARDSEAEET